MLHRSERILDNIPVGSLGIIAVDGCEEMGNKVNDYLVKWRKEETRFQKDNLVFNGYEKPNGYRLPENMEHLLSFHILLR